eukprot:3183629-Pleurochrysis_carterae.AAC.1
MHSLLPHLYSRACVLPGSTAVDHVHPVWISWLALVSLTTAVLSDSFIECIDKSKPDSITRLDDLQLSHHTAFLAVPEYSGCQKPKHMMSANYPVDVLNTGPLVRTWCMTFEAML